MLRWTVLLLLASRMTACHDAPRDNPLDPELTPPVDLTAVADDTAGTVTLSWSQYAGETAFREYLVLRNVVHSTVAETLYVATSVNGTLYTDRRRRPDTAYEYRVAAVSQGGLSRGSASVVVPGYSVQGVRLLAVESDSLAGSVRLAWSRYRGATFGEYQVWRRVVGTDHEELLHAERDPADTSWTDPAVLSETDYTYRVATLAAGLVLGGNSLETRLRLPRVAITRTEFSATTASAIVVWSPYRGPRFAAYRLERRSTGLTWETVFEGRAIGDTSHVDLGLLGNTEYIYRVTVVTGQNEATWSAEQAGAFHRALAPWPLAVAEDECVRLYVEDDHLVVLLASPTQVRRLIYNQTGTQTGEQLLYALPVPAIQPRSVAWVATADGGWLTIGLEAPSAGSMPSIYLLRLDSDGHFLYHSRAPFLEGLTSLPPDTAPVSGQLSLAISSGAYIEKMRLSRDGETLFADDFEDGDLAGWNASGQGQSAHGWFCTIAHAGDQGDTPGAVLAAASSVWAGSWVEVEAGLGGQAVYRVRGDRHKDEWLPGAVTITLGGPGNEGQRCTVTLEPEDLRLAWVRSGRLALSAIAKDFIPILGLPYRLGLGSAAGLPGLTIGDPVVWATRRAEAGSLAGLAMVDDFLVLVAGQSPWHLSANDATTAMASLGTPASAVRTWRRKSMDMLALCLPQAHQVAIAQVTASLGRLSWPFVSLSSGAVTRLAGSVGSELGSLVFPLSVDVGPDQRLYVLDAGNGRVQVFGSDLRPLTSIGRRGTGNGEFDFGQGTTAEDFRGDVVVDRQGTILVADPGNQRIQRFGQ